MRDVKTLPVSPDRIKRILAADMIGSVAKTVGLSASVVGFPAPLGAICQVMPEYGEPVEAEVVGFQHDETIIVPYGRMMGVRAGNRVSLVQSVPFIRVGDRLLGRVIDGRGRAIDGRPQPVLPDSTALYPDARSPLQKPPIDRPLSTGVRVIDGLLTCGRGQRLGIFSGSGVGKSTLLGQMARASDADVNVVVQVGERGREVREFIERDLGPDGLQRTVVVVATSDEPALLRLRSAYLGTAIAEYFRDRGLDVLMLMDSVTRFALAQREVGLAAGEPPATRGYPPSVFASLPRLLERSGRTEQGSITGFYTVLVEGDDTNEPISDAVRGILDGHIMLSRSLAERGQWPAIDVLASISRSMSAIVDSAHAEAATVVKRLTAAYQQAQDMIEIGAYQAGSNPLVDQSIQLRQPILDYVQQASDQRVTLPEAVQQLDKLNRIHQALLMHQKTTAEVGTPISQRPPSISDHPVTNG
ncbi:MAG: FliI/YscN family ATPase [Planctomycetaceae bacterium]